MSRITDLECVESLPSDRWSWKRLALLSLLFTVFLCGDLSAAESRKDSALTLRLKRELAYLKTQNVLTVETVTRYRNLYLEMPAHLTSGERDVWEQYQHEYSRLRKVDELAKSEKMFAHYEQLDAARRRAIAEERARQRRFHKAPVLPKKKVQPVTGKKKNVETEKQAAARLIAERKHVEDQMKRELAALYPRAYSLTSKRILVTSVKEKDRYASEFANAVKLFEDWQAKWNMHAKRKPYLSAVIKAQCGKADPTLTFLKTCQSIHEFAYKGGEKMRGVRINRYRVISTNWQGIDYADAGNHYQSRLRAANLNSAVKMLLVAQSARRLKKHTESLNGIPLLACYHLLAGNADIVARLNLTPEQKQNLVAHFKPWGLPEKEIQILLKVEQNKTESGGNSGIDERY